MILVDTSVWIDFFKNTETEEVLALEALIDSEESVSYTGIILQEIFQGVNSANQRRRIEEDFAPFIELFPQKNNYFFAAELFRKSRSNGHPVRSSIDCLIAALAIENDCKLLQRDRDFGHIAEVSSLLLIEPG